MRPNESAGFTEANKTVHAVETQWHYAAMTAAGFQPTTKTAVGFVRSYDYTHPSGHVMRVSTGASSDYWQDLTLSKTGYHGELQAHLKYLRDIWLPL